MSDRPKISVAVITYNQQDVLPQALDSVLMQQGDFDLEIIVGEDCSPDNTYSVCLDYQRRYPDVIRVLHGPQNIGITANFFRVLQACTGDFIADLDGDDFYCDPLAFQKQLTYFGQHPEVGVLAPNGYSYYVKRNKKVLGRNEIVNKVDAKEFFFNPNHSGGVIIQGSGSMLRSELLRYLDYDEMLRRKLPVEDYPIQAIWSQHTKFGWMPDPIYVYRIYKTSSTFVPVTHPKYLSINRGLMDTRRYLNELFPQDACFTEEWMQDYEFYKEYLLYLHKWQYGKAKALLASAEETKAYNQPHYMQAKRMTRNRLRFIAFAMYKEWTYIKDIKKRT